jgi:hypothetical protein
MIMKSAICGLAAAIACCVALPANAALVGQWNFTETSGTVAHDSSGSGIDGTLAGGATFDPHAGPGGGGAVELTPGPDYATSLGPLIDMGDNYNFSGLATFSTQVWVKLTPGDTHAMFAVSRESSGIVEGYFTGLNNIGPGASYTDKAVAYSGGPCCSNWTPPSSITINDGQWHQLVSVYDASTISLYVDGAFQSSVARLSINPANSVHFTVGGGYDAGSNINLFSGLVSDAAVWDNALSDSDVATLYQTTLAGVPEPSMWALMLIGVGMLGAMVRSRVARRDFRAKAKPRSVALAVSALALALAGGQAKAANLLTNGGFEAGTFAGWAQSGDTTYTYVEPSGYSSITAEEGGNYVWEGPASDGYLSQTFSDTAGQTLHISGWVFNPAGPNGDFSMSFNGAPQVVVDPIPNQSWTEYQFDVLATGSDTLKIGFSNPPSHSGLDDFSVTPLASVPEPTTWALMLLGMGGLGATARRWRLQTRRAA